MTRITCIRCAIGVDSHSSAAKYCRPCGRLQADESKAASREVLKSVRRGDIPKASTLSCADCGKPALDYDHRDYNRPLDVQAVCRGCNVRRGPAIALKAA